jgi:hypothetical protein
VDAFQMVPGLPPAEGSATAAVRGGLLTALTLEGNPDAHARRDAALRAASDAVAAATVVAVVAALQATGSPLVFPAPHSMGMPPPSAGTDLGWPLAVAGLGAAAFALLAARQRVRRSRSS